MSDQHQRTPSKPANYLLRLPNPLGHVGAIRSGSRTQEDIFRMLEIPVDSRIPSVITHRVTHMRHDRVPQMAAATLHPTTFAPEHGTASGRSPRY